MREILFKAKRVDNGEWIQGSLILNPFAYAPQIGNISYVGYDDTRKDVWGKWFVKEETICQFTGLFDKNRNKIFEGDILEIDVMKFTVVYLDGSFRLQFSNNKNRGQLYQERCNEMIIIGNIHEKQQ